VCRLIWIIWRGGYCCVRLKKIIRIGSSIDYKIQKYTNIIMYFSRFICIVCMFLYVL